MEWRVRNEFTKTLNHLVNILVPPAGIPAADLKEHERQKQGSRSNDSGSDDDEPTNKRVKTEGLLGNAPGVMQGVPGMMPGMIPPPSLPPGMQMGHMMHMGPPFMHPG